MNSALRKQRQEDLHEFEVNQVYIASSRKGIERDPVSQQQQQKKIFLEKSYS